MPTAASRRRHSSAQDTPFSIDELKVLLTGKLAKYEMPTEMEMGASRQRRP